MKINDYQEAALKTAIYSEDYKVIYPTLGLVGEAGEVADKIKKVIRDNNGYFDKDKSIGIMKELGDVLWYIATLSKDLGFTLEEVAQTNLDKLASRQQRNELQGSGDER